MAKGGRRLHTGPKGKPTEMKVVQGTFRVDRHTGEVRVPAGWPEAPAHLTEREKSLWGLLEQRCALWVAPSDWLALNGVVSLVDRILRNQEAQRETDSAGHPLAFKHVVMTPNEEQSQKGIQTFEIVEAKENPLLSQEVKLWRELRAFIGITGLSPADRTRVQKLGAEDKPANPLDKFIKRKRG